jgi:hypothetical protein
MKNPFIKPFIALFFIMFLLKNASAIHTISSFSPVSAFPRVVVTITGTNLAPTVGAVHVFFGNAKAQVLAVYNDSLKVRVPFGATVAPITISVNGFTVATLNHFVPSYPASTATPTNLNFWPTEGNLNLSYTGQTLRQYASADLDNDGKLDLISTVYFSSSTTSGMANLPYIYRLRVFRNIAGNAGGIANTIIDPNYLDLVGDSTVYSHKYGRIWGFKTGDINSDGFLDIVTRMDSGITIFVNKGLGFSHTMFNRINIQHPLLDSKPNASSSEQILLVDFDGNGKLDILVMTPVNVILLSNNSMGSSFSSTNLSLSNIRTVRNPNPYINNIYYGRLTNDDRPDIFFHNIHHNSDSIFFLENKFGITSNILDSAAFSGPSFINTILQPKVSQVCDLNNDGLMDIATVYQTFNGFLQNASGTVINFLGVTSVAQGSPLEQMLLGDITGDGIVDIVTAWGGGIVVRRNRHQAFSIISADSFTNTTYSRPTFGLQEMANTLFDLDNDGRPDLVTTRQVITGVPATNPTANLLISRNTYALRTPTVNVSSATYNNLSPTSIRITINTPGNGTGRVVLIKSGTAAITSFPVNYTYYAATQVFGTSPTLADGSRVVYVGDTNVVNITGLSPFTTYRIAIVEMNGWANATTFLTTNVFTTTGTTLPVSWLSFEGNKSQEGIDLFWKTASEKNNDYFEVQRSFNMQNWETIGKVKGKGTTNTTSQYSYTDNEAILTANNENYPVVYYRLKQVDYDGSTDYSTAISFDLYQNEEVKEEFVVEIYPVPFNETLTLQTNAESGFDYSIIDNKGLEVLKGSSKNKTHELYTSELRNGMYVVLVKNRGTDELRVVKVVKSEL